MLKTTKHMRRLSAVAGSNSLLCVLAWAGSSFCAFAPKREFKIPHHPRYKYVIGRGQASQGLWLDKWHQLSRNKILLWPQRKFARCAAGWKNRLGMQIIPERFICRNGHRKKKSPVWSRRVFFLKKILKLIERLLLLLCRQSQQLL